MPVLYINCPETGQPVPTGKVVPKSMPADHMIGNVMKCEECHRLYKWQGKEAFYFNEDGAKIYIK